MKIAKILALALVCILTATMFMACSTYSSTTTTDADGTKTTKTTENGVTTETVEEADDADTEDAEPAEGGTTLDDVKAKFSELADLYDGGMEAIAATEDAGLIETYKEMGDQLRSVKEVIATKGEAATEAEMAEAITTIDALIEQVKASLEQIS